MLSQNCQNYLHIQLHFFYLQHNQGYYHCMLYYLKTAKCFEMKVNALIVSIRKVKQQIQPSQLERKIARIVRRFQVLSYVSMWDSQPVNKIDLYLLIARNDHIKIRTIIQRKCSYLFTNKKVCQRQKLRYQQSYSSRNGIWGYVKTDLSDGDYSDARKIIFQQIWLRHSFQRYIKPNFLQVIKVSMFCLIF